MKTDRIIIKKEMIPYNFSIDLYSTTFIFEIRYNAECDFFTIGLFDRDGNLLCYEPITYGAELFKPQYQAGVYPAMRIVPQDDSGQNSVVTWENFNETVFLTIDNV